MSAHHRLSSYVSVFFFNDTSTTEIYTLSLHDALPISENAFLPAPLRRGAQPTDRGDLAAEIVAYRSEEHTSELQSRFDLVCRLLLEKKKTKVKYSTSSFSLTGPTIF